MGEYTVNVGKVFIGRVVKIGVKGDGIIFMGKMVVFIPGGVVGFKYKFEIVSVTDRFGNGRILEEYGGGA